MIYFINALSLSRIIFAAVIFVLISNSQSYNLCLFLFALSSVSDYFDGYLARKYNVTSDFGEIIDPVADKILLIFILIALSINFSSYLVGFLSSLIVSREVWVAALRDFNSRNDNSRATKVIFISKIKTTIQFFTIFIYLAGLSFEKNLMLIIGDLLLMISALITIYTGYLYTVKTLYSDN